MDERPANSARESASSWTRLCFPQQEPVRLAALCLAGMLIAAIFLPTTWANFDFADDGITAHPTGIASLAEYNRSVWHRTAVEFRHKGPYRPVAWYFWNGQQEWCNGNPLGWRVFRFLWTVLAAVTFVWFLHELGFGAGAIIITTMAAWWNGYRAEVWLSPTLCEGIAMPFAMVGLVCAYRAPRSKRAWAWDISAFSCALLAIGCKNVFAAIVPAQMFLRVLHPDFSLREGVRYFGWRAALLGSVLVFPIVHFIAYRLTMHEERYLMAWDPQQPLRLLQSFLGAMGKDFLGPALALALVVTLWAWLRGAAPLSEAAESNRFRAALGAGLALFAFGYGVYVPMAGVAGRYTFPGVWGLDVLCALLWTQLFSLPSRLQKVTYVLLAGGLIMSAVAIVGKQEKNLARLDALWDALYVVESQASIGSRVGWVAVDDRRRTEELEFSDGIHFRWHLQGRGRNDLYWQDLAPGDALSSDLAIVITSSPAAPAGWELLKECRRSYWFGRKEVVCCVWRRIEPTP
jgi:hypothetical protein